MTMCAELAEDKQGLWFNFLQGMLSTGATLLLVGVLTGWTFQLSASWGYLAIPFWIAAQFLYGRLHRLVEGRVPPAPSLVTGLLRLVVFLVGALLAVLILYALIF